MQPGIKIDYKTGKTSVKNNPSDEIALAIKYGATSVNPSAATTDTGTETTSNGKLDDHSKADDAREYVLNTNTKRFHYPSCSSVDDMKEKNKWRGTFSRAELIAHGYKSCGRCHP